MNDKLKSVFAAMGVIVAVGAGLVGFKTRQQTDLGGIEASNKSMPYGQILASRSNDVNIPAAQYFYDLSEQLKLNYVEPVTDEEKLAAGAVRGMVTSLEDPNSNYFDKNVFPVFVNERAGKYEGIGADLELTFKSKSTVKGKARTLANAPSPESGSESPEEAIDGIREIPELVAASVVPGGPADRAGVKPGDTVYSVDGHWIVQSDLIKKFRNAAKLYTEKKMKLTELNVLRNELRTKFERSMFPAKARDHLIAGRSGAVSVVWDRNGAQRSTKIEKAPSEMPPFSAKDDVIRLPFTPGSAADLKTAIRGKHEVTIDLRENSLGDDKVMKECLAAIAPKGTYGYVTTFRHESPTPLTVLAGNSNPPRVKLLVNSSTRGPAEVFAMALSLHGIATLGAEKMGGDPAFKQVVKLSDGSGYTLLTAMYTEKSIHTKVAKRGGAR